MAGLLAFWAIVDLPATAGFLTEEERAWVVYVGPQIDQSRVVLTLFLHRWRKRSDGSSVGEVEKVSWKYIGQALGSWQVWLSTAYYLSISTPLYSVGLFLPTSSSRSFLNESFDEADRVFQSSNLSGNTPLRKYSF